MRSNFKLQSPIPRASGRNVLRDREPEPSGHHFPGSFVSKPLAHELCRKLRTLLRYKSPKFLYYSRQVSGLADMTFLVSGSVAFDL